MRRPLLLLLGLLLLHQGHCFEFVIDGEWEEEASEVQDHRQRHKRAILTSEEEEDFQAIRGDDITVKSYRVESRITSRFAHVTVRSSVVNSGSKAQSIGFNVQIPKQAFITNFTMNVNGITFVGSVKEKTVARNLYTQARARGKAAGIIRANSQDMETFKTEVHVPSGSNIEFELHYQEMMHRKLGHYEHNLYLQPGRLVPQFQVDVYIFEPKGISMVQTSNTLGQQFTELIKVVSTDNKAHIVFKPNLQQQRKCDNCTDSAIDGTFTVMYDVKRDSNAGELQVSDGHFVHFFAPTNLSPLPKNIVFVIDVSGSMWGVKMKQTVEAMQAILDDLTLDDQFSIIDFNHNVRCWSEDLVSGSSIQIADASNQGLIDSRSVSMIILVSDGDPTVGKTDHAIQKNVRKIMREEFSLFSLGIGFDVDFDFLERIAMENRGIAQRIYANHDAAEQLRTFYSQVSSPLLRRIAIQFPEDSVSEVTQNRFDKYFSGSELVVAGKVLPSESNTLTKLDTELVKHQHSFTGFARQMWAYITIKQLISDRATVLNGSCRPHMCASHPVDNDPHFIVHLPGSNMDVCFNIDSKPGHILNLVSDRGTGVVVNGQLISSKQVHNSKLSTYFGTISVDYQPDGVSVTITTDMIAMSDGSNNHSFTWAATAEITQDGVRINIVKNSHVIVTVNDNIQVMVLLHRVYKKHPVNVDFLGVYIPNDNQYSPVVHGLIGQFSREPEVNVFDIHEGADPLKKEATMEVKGNKLLVTRGWQKDYRRDTRQGSNVYCWFIHNSGKGFIDGHYTDYIVPDLHSFL
uniref:Inter-alpha-trypsin inhibitor heavy chain 2 n=1 Tax=Anabas testudineus TaxID=64144 RepID=A0A7N6B8R3_ANATE